MPKPKKKSKRAKPKKDKEPKFVDELIRYSGRLLALSNDHVIAACETVAYARCGTSKLRLETLERAIEAYRSADALGKLIYKNIKREERHG